MNGYIEAGLPNIIGHTTNFQGHGEGDNISGSYGAFGLPPSTYYQGGDGNGSNDQKTRYNSDSFDASYGQTLIDGELLDHSDPKVVYGKSNTVQPPAFQVDYYIKAR